MLVMITVEALTQEVRARLHRRRRRHLHRRHRPRHRVPRPQRRRQVHDDAHHGRPDPGHLRHRPHRRAPLRRPAQPRHRGRGPPRRLGAARRPHRAARSSPSPSARWACPRARVQEMLDLVSLTSTEADRRVRDYSLGMRQRLGIGDRPPRRPARPHPRRAGERPRPCRHPLDARPAARLRRPAAAPSCSPRTCSTRSRSSPTTSSSSATGGSSRRGPRPSCSPAPARSSERRDAAAPGRGDGAPPATTHHGRPDGSVHTDAGARPGRRGRPRAGVALTELRAAGGAGLEEMFLDLTADTQREGAAA